jgi:2-polyprenyl-3-methyl-5-hydroxy-6-metoxy-1,4-benzoquinol methylase
MLHKTDNETIMQLKDKHLTAELSIYVENIADNRKNISAITMVHFHNKLGIAYFFVIRPFHKIIVKTLLNKSIKDISKPSARDTKKKNMKEFWNKRFMEKQCIWGNEPSNIAILCEKLFKENNVKDILIMGVGYGRNGKYFIENGYNVDGIEISEEAINIGKQFAPKINFINGSVLDMSLNKKYDAIFCYDIMQLFRKNERKMIAKNCIKHCKDNGIIMLSCLSINDVLFGKGNEIEENTFEIREGLTVHFSNEKEMKNMDEELSVVEIEYSTEKIEGEKERNRIYGIYNVLRRSAAF